MVGTVGARSPWYMPRLSDATNQGNEIGKKKKRVRRRVCVLEATTRVSPAAIELLRHFAFAAFFLARR